jgi:O-antigen/teichoic acid export membrane protein
MTVSLRGVLEAIQRFDLTNAIKIPASVSSYLGPLVVLLFVDSLVAVVGFLVISRGAVLLAHLLLCLRALPVLSCRFRFVAARIRPLIGFGGWLTVTSFMGPFITSVDRFMIGAFVSLSAITLYVTPYEALAKLMIFSTSLLGVLFPAFSALAVNRIWEIRRLYARAFRYLLVLVAPIVGMLLALAFDLLSLWVGVDLALDSAPVAKWLAVAFLIHVLANIPLTTIQSLGRADAPAKLQLVLLLVYLLALWYLVRSMAITGVAIAFTLWTTVEAVGLFVVAERLLPASGKVEDRFSWLNLGIVSAFLLLFLGIGSLLSGAIVLKVAVVVCLLAVFVGWEWLFFLKKEDRNAFIGQVKSILKRSS